MMGARQSRIHCKIKERVVSVAILSFCIYVCLFAFADIEMQFVELYLVDCRR